MKEKEISINELARQMADGFAEIKCDNNDFAIAVAKGFDEANEKSDKRFSNIESQIKILNSKFDLHDAEFKIIGSQMDKGFRELQKEAEEIKLRLDKIERITKEDISALGDEVYHIKLRTKKLELKNSQT